MSWRKRRQIVKHFIQKSAAVLLLIFVFSPVAGADNQRSCYFAFGNGVTEQIVVPPGAPPNPNIGPIRLRIGRVVVHGNVDVLTTEGFNVFGLNFATGEGRITGLAKGTFDFGDLGAFYTWEVDTATLIGPPPWEYSYLEGNIRTGPNRDVVPDPQAPPTPWGTGFFADTDATLKGTGWNRFNVVNQNGDLVNEFTYFVWGKICDVDLKGIRDAQRN
jgi:hypothetical protein